MTETINFTAPPISCSHFGREIEFLFCFACAMTWLDDAAIHANAKEIRAIARRPAGKTPGAGNCLICGVYIPARTMARVLPGRRIYAHVECVSQLLARLEAGPPQKPQPLAGDLPFDGVLEVD